MDLTLPCILCKEPLPCQCAEGIMMEFYGDESRDIAPYVEEEKKEVPEEMKNKFAKQHMVNLMERIVKLLEKRGWRGDEAVLNYLKEIKNGN